eukprot:6285853-Amphidinium_carterae.1
MCRSDTISIRLDSKSVTCWDTSKIAGLGLDAPTSAEITIASTSTATPPSPCTVPPYHIICK